MDIVAGHVYRWTLKQAASGSVMYNVLDTECTGTFGDIDMADVALAYWNDIKTAWRGLYPTDAGNVFTALAWADLSDPTGAFGEFAIPIGERTGTRAPTAQPQYLSSLVACGVRLTVGSRLTRPGQKRLYGITEGDVDGNYFTAGYQAAAAVIGAKIVAGSILGAPAIGVQLEPVVVRLDETGALDVWQPVTGYLVNPIITSQRSRRLGHGI